MIELKVNVIQRMEELEEKYGIHLHVEQYMSDKVPDSYYQVLKEGSFKKEDFEFLGHTLDEVEKSLELKYGKK